MTTPKIEMDMISRLPLKIAEKILFYLSPKQLRKASSCYSSWKAIIRNDSRWKMICQYEGFLEVEECQRTSFYNRFIKKYNYWQGVYWYNRTLLRNWKQNYFKDNIFKIKYRCVPNWFLLDDLIFAFISLDRTKLYVYALNQRWISFRTLSLKTDVQGNGKIWKTGRYIIQFIKGKSLTVWDSENLRRKKMLVNGLVFDECWDHVTNVESFKDLFLLECKYKFQVLNIETKEIEYEYNGIYEKVYITDGRIVYSTKDHSIHVLKWEDKSSITFTCGDLEAKGQHTILVNNDILIGFCTIGELIFLHAWNITSKKKLYSKNLGEKAKFREAFFVNKYLCIKYFQSKDDNGNSLEQFQLLKYRKGTVVDSVTDLDSTTATASTNGLSIRASRSGTLGLWCFKTRDFIWNFSDLPDSCFIITKTKLAIVILKNGYHFVVMRSYDV